MKLRIAILLALAGISAAACGSYNEANGFNLPDPNAQHNDSHLTWIRLDSPKNYPTIVYTCHDGDGIYITQDAGASVKVVANDPACKGNTPTLTAAFRKIQPCDALNWYSGDSPYIILKEEPPGLVPFLEARVRFVSNPDCPLEDGLISIVVQKKIRVGIFRYKWIRVPGMEAHKDFAGPFHSVTLTAGPVVCVTPKARYRVHIFIYALNLPKSVLVYEPGGNGKVLKCKFPRS